MPPSARLGIGFAAFAFTLLLAGSSAADCSLSSKYRAMHGSIASVSGGKLTLAQRGGAKVEFAKAGGVSVMGAKSSWSALATGDNAIVGWLISDSPAVAYEVCVLPKS
jgi:hypothetical protein